jgi:hypothetical protein
MFRYPLGGNLSWALQHILGLKDLGHDVYFVEKWVYEDSCYDAGQKVMSNDCTYGLKVVGDLFKRYGLEGKWCFVQKGEIYHGLSRKEIEEVFRTADVYIDFGANNAWAEEALSSASRVWIDGDPGFTQFRLSNNLAQGIPVPAFDYYYTNGKNVGRDGNVIPTAGIKWRHFYSPVVTRLFDVQVPPRRAVFSTVMNWQSFEPIRFNGVTYGHKDIEFAKIMELPRLAKFPMEVAVSGNNVPHKQLAANGWTVKNGHDVTISFDSFQHYLYAAKAEFSICKNVYVATRSGWFSDKSVAYLASARPVILQDTGFIEHLPTGEGLLAFSTLEEAKDAIENVSRDYRQHAKKAREIAIEYFESKKALQQLLDEL